MKVCVSRWYGGLVLRFMPVKRIPIVPADAIRERWISSLIRGCGFQKLVEDGVTVLIYMFSRPEAAGKMT